ncbi:hypothetical protein DERF_002820 [Dermatophagoides farinae]|uniref:Uncharacterized protein n=1 Tax=Dermatophagoides farinae TaxID=6954 RepID=A0A922IDM1_DERFA|nr:hypothetical protein DERF_002820 [Dermatophagoides farinae]
MSIAVLLCHKLLLNELFTPPNGNVDDTVVGTPDYDEDCVCTYDRFAENVNLFGCDDVDVFETLKLKPLLLLGLMLVDVKSNPVLFPLDGVGFNIDDDPIANMFDELLANEF